MEGGLIAYGQSSLFFCGSSDGDYVCCMFQRKSSRSQSRFHKGANLQGMNLDGEDLSNLDLHELNLRGASLRGANLNGSDLTLSDFFYADLEGATFKGAYLNGCCFRSANLNGADFSRAIIRTPYDTADPEQGVSFEYVGVRGEITTWRYKHEDPGRDAEAILTRPKEKDPKIESDMFAHATLRNARFFRTLFQHGNWQSSGTEVVQNGQRVWCKRFTGLCYGVSFLNADLTGAEFIENEICDYETAVFQGSLYRRGIEKGELDYEKFIVNFKGADLTGATFRFIKERVLNPDKSCGFEDHYGHSVLGFESAKLDGTSFIGDLSTVTLLWTDLEGADLSNAINYDPTTTYFIMGHELLDTTQTTEG